MKKKILPIVIAVIIFAAFTFFIPKESVTLSLKDNMLSVAHMTKTGSQQTEDARIDIDLTQVKRVSLLENIDFGTQQEGVITNKCSYGTWKNDSFGSYQLFIYNNVKQYTSLELDDGSIVIINMESNAMTESFCNALQKYIAENIMSGEM